MAIRNRTKNIAERKVERTRDKKWIIIFTLSFILCLIGIKLLFFTSVWDVLQLLDSLTTIYM